MFGKFSALIQQAFETLGPVQNPKQDFTAHWKAVLFYFLDRKDFPVSVDHTSLPKHLNRMLELLSEENQLATENQTGPCVEYMLEHRVLEALCSLGQADRPPGLKGQVLLFTSRLVSNLKPHLLPHIGIIRALMKLVSMCGDVRASPSESEEIQLLCSLCARLRSNPDLVNFFIEVKARQPQQIPLTSTSEQSVRSSTTSSLSSTSSSSFTISPPSLSETTNSVSSVVNGPPSQPLQQPESPNSPQESPVYKNIRKFRIVDCLLKMIHSPDARIAVKACEGLVLCASLPDAWAAQVMVTSTMFCEELVDLLCALYKRLPKIIDPNDIANVHAKWGLDAHCSSEDLLSFPSKRSVVSFLSWFDFCDQLIANAHSSIGSALSEHIGCYFFNDVIEPVLQQSNENTVITLVALFTRLVNMTCSQPLKHVIATFLLGIDRTADNSKLWLRLIDRCDSLSDELSLTTLKLLEALVLKFDEEILSRMLISSVVDMPFKVKSTALVNSDVEMVVTEQKDVTTLDTPTEETSSDDKLGELAVPINGDDQSPSHQIADNSNADFYPDWDDELSPNVRFFLDLSGAISKQTSTQSSYDFYIYDARRQYMEASNRCREITWPARSITEDEIVTYCEGVFLEMLLNKLSRLFSQSYAINLQLTSIFARLALLPEPHLHSYLLDSTSTLLSPARSLPTVLSQLCDEVVSRAKTIENFDDQLSQWSQQLLVSPAGFKSVLERYQRICSPDDNFVVTVIVLQEFCKELAAIAFVKQHDPTL